MATLRTELRVAAQLAFAEAMVGWVKSGGIWGDAYWREFSPTLRASISQEGNDSPTMLCQPVNLFIYLGEADEMSPEPEWTIETGEAPHCEDERLFLIECRSVTEALKRCEHLLAAARTIR